MNPLFTALGGAMAPGGGGLSMGTNSATGAQHQNLNFQGGTLNMPGNDSGNQILLIGALLVAAYIVLKKGK